MGWAPDAPAVEVWLEGEAETNWVVPDDVSPASSDGWPPDTLSVLPDSSTPFGLSPLAAASWLTLTPAREAIAHRVSPGWTTYPPDELAGCAADTSVVLEVAAESVAPVATEPIAAV